MSDNAVVILDNVLRQAAKDSGLKLPPSDFFELFSFTELLKDYDPSQQELEAGWVDDSDDGGIDGYFLFADGNLVQSDTPLDDLRKGVKLELILFQAKTAASFAETPIDHMIASAEDIFDLTATHASLSSSYNGQLVDAVLLFRDALLKTAGKHHQISVRYIYCCRGEVKSANSKVRHRAKTLKKIVSAKLPNAVVEFEFVGARELLEARDRVKAQTLTLKFIDNYISRGPEKYVLLTRLDEYVAFCTDGDRRLRKYLFDGNVRDYLGNVDVNKDIRETLANNKPKEALDFWWLNNGITVLASKATIAGKSLHLDDVQIVNGLQTTQTIFDYFNASAKEDDRLSFSKS